MIGNWKVLFAIVVALFVFGCVQLQPQAQSAVQNATPPVQTPAQPPQSPTFLPGTTTGPSETEPATSNATPTLETSSPFGSMLAYNINDAGISINTLQTGWSEFRKDGSNLQRLKNNLKRTFQKRTALLKQTGFPVDREIAAYFTWNVIEPEKGQFDWELTDSAVQAAGEGGVKLTAVVQPFASWDQTDTVANPRCKALDFAYYDYKAGPPNDFAEYRNFLTKLVERYKGRVAYWEIGNEIEGACGGFESNAEGYVKLLNVSFGTIKAADPQAKVLNGGALEVVKMPDAEATKSFWRKFFGLGGGHYLDYFNLHYNIGRSGASQAEAVSGTSASFTEDLAFYNDLMEKNGGRKPIWITEFGTYSGTPQAPGGQQGQPQQQNGADEKLCGDGYCNEIERTTGGCPQDCGGQFQQQQAGQPPQQAVQSQPPGTPQPQAQTGDLPTQSEEFQAAWYLRNSIIGFANGADRIFIDFIGQDNDTVGSSAAFNIEGEPRLFVTTLKTISIKISGFSNVEKIAEGQYRFTVENKTVYALWSGTLPNEISGSVKVTDMKGQEQLIDAAEIELNADYPVFIELPYQN